MPSRGTVLRRVAQLDPLKATQAREGRDAARSKRSAGGAPPEIVGLLQQVQMDHTPVDVIVVDERHRLPIGRPYVTVAIDVVSRCIVGLVVTLEAPSATSVGLCLARMATGKQAWLEQLGVDAVWPMSGKPHELYVDNAAEFKSEALRRGCEQHGIALSYRPPGLPHFGGIVERVIGTMMRLVHDELPGTTFSNVGERGAYDSDGRAVMTMTELNAWLALAVACYHGQIHDGLSRTPAAIWAELAERDGTPGTVSNETAFLIDFLPVIRRTVTRSGFQVDHVQYYCDALKPWIAQRAQLASSCCAGIRATSPGSGRSIRTVRRTCRCRTGSCRDHRSAFGNSRPRSPACVSRAAPTSTSSCCSPRSPRCATSPIRPQRRPARRGGTESGVAPCRLPSTGSCRRHRQTPSQARPSRSR
ncbi:Mu transposase C-terminal domain-containing protein [Kribbella sp. DT2]|uniref:Mu transposase C-terminal domain-containing protein n=1 Tax=Kribbella sp. DT2 TaxID=3393427 RepID=UPI003CFADE42